MTEKLAELIGPLVEVVGLEEPVQPLQEPQGFLTKDFLMSCLRKPVESNMCGIYTADWKDDMLPLIRYINPSRLGNAASTWMQDRIWDPREPKAQGKSIAKWVEDKVNDVQDQARELGRYYMLEFSFGEIVREDGLQWTIPRTILGSQLHHKQLEDYDPDNPRKWSFDNIYLETLRWMDRDPDDAYQLKDQNRQKIRSGIPFLMKIETVWWFLAMFEIFYDLGFRCFQLTQLQLMTWQAPEAYNVLRTLVTAMRNWALYGTIDPGQMAVQRGDPIIVGCSQRQGLAFPDPNPFSTRYLPLFDYQTGGLHIDLREWSAQWNMGEGDPQLNYQPYFGRRTGSSSPEAPGADWRYPTNNPYELPTLIGIDNASGCPDDMTWFALLTKERRDKNLGLIAFELASMSEKTYFSLPLSQGGGCCLEHAYCYGGRCDDTKIREQPDKCKLCRLAGKGPDTMTYLPAQDGGGRLLAIRAGRYWLYAFHKEGETGSHPVFRFVSQGLLRDLLLTEGSGQNTREQLRVAGEITLPTGKVRGYELFPWSGPLFGGSDEWQIRSGPDVILYLSNIGRFLIIKGTRLLNTWEHYSQVE